MNPLLFTFDDIQIIAMAQSLLINVKINFSGQNQSGARAGDWAENRLAASTSAWCLLNPGHLGLAETGKHNNETLSSCWVLPSKKLVAS